jgi:hypothetical protein
LIFRKKLKYSFNKKKKIQEDPLNFRYSLLSNNTKVLPQEISKNTTNHNQLSPKPKKSERTIFNLTLFDLQIYIQFYALFTFLFKIKSFSFINQFIKWSRIKCILMKFTLMKRFHIHNRVI